MTKFLLLILVVVLVTVSGCETHSGSREYVPGKGWIQND
jgi:predicted small secreted protein